MCVCVYVCMYIHICVCLCVCVHVCVCVRGHGTKDGTQVSLTHRQSTTTISHLLSYAERIVVNHDAKVLVPSRGLEGKSEVSSL